MRAWLTPPHGRRHKAPPQPCALTTTTTQTTTAHTNTTQTNKTQATQTSKVQKFLKKSLSPQKCKSSFKSPPPHKSKKVPSKAPLSTTVQKFLQKSLSPQKYKSPFNSPSPHNSTKVLSKAPLPTKVQKHRGEAQQTQLRYVVSAPPEAGRGAAPCLGILSDFRAVNFAA